MKILIPTFNRTTQHTLNSLPYEIQQNTFLVSPIPLPYDQVIIQPEHIRGIANKRQWMMEWAAEKGWDTVVMLDDDLRFSRRRTDNPKLFEQATHRDIAGAFYDMKAMPSLGYVHFGMSARGGANFVTDDYVQNTRMTRVLGYDVKTFMMQGIRFNRVPLMEDFDVTLQLLRKGYPNILINDLVHDQGSSNAPGGCSTYRTMEMQAEAAEKLASLHPEFVTVVKKQTKTSWGGQERTDVRVRWKAAFGADL